MLIYSLHQKKIMTNRLIVILILFFQISFAQEFVNPLVFNSQIPQKFSKSIFELNSSIELPFYDDFSNYLIYPKTSHWIDNDVFINRNYPVNPINIGVATFDGLDSIGRPRNLSSETVHGSSDYLTSRPIDLSNLSEVYLSFYLQSTGLGNEPEFNDIFMLEFLDADSVWQIIWDTTGYSLSDFEKINITINENTFLHNTFQFRFHNKATLSGNFDHWHIDNVLLTDDLSLFNDIEDVAFVYETSQMLNFYSSIPWKHFDQNRAVYMASNMDTWVRNNYMTTQSVDYSYDIYTQDNDLIFHYPSTGPSRNDEIPPFQTDNFSYSDDSPTAITVGVSAFPSSSIDLKSNSFTIVQSLATDDNDLFKVNDTLKYVQNFDNYYALDDGSAEASYGINVEGGMVAMLFNISENDTLKAVQIHFEENYEDSDGLAFSITLWNKESDIPSDVIYQSQIFYPEFTDFKNGFYEYVLENPVSVSGPVFIGWQQYYDEIINIGLDKNTINNDRMFYNLGSGWNQSNCADCDGTWMIRPVFGSLTASSIENGLSNSFSVFPNPASSSVNVEYDEPHTISIINLSGKQVYKNFSEGRLNIDLQSFSKGVYILETKSNYQKHRKKLVVQ
ncbi:MAG: hypothetical protein CMP70_00450 [Flavobacteriales bacterium]|nr:hypothetical protein [Flavobacteriales bacterium]